MIEQTGVIPGSDSSLILPGRFAPIRARNPRVDIGKERSDQSIIVLIVFDYKNSYTIFVHERCFSQDELTPVAHERAVFLKTHTISAFKIRDIINW